MAASLPRAVLSRSSSIGSLLVRNEGQPRCNCQGSATQVWLALRSNCRLSYAAAGQLVFLARASISFLLRATHARGDSSLS